jgi:hypothetical protein
LCCVCARAVELVWVSFKIALIPNRKYPEPAINMDPSQPYASGRKLSNDFIFVYQNKWENDNVYTS